MFKGVISVPELPKKFSAALDGSGAINKMLRQKRKKQKDHTGLSPVEIYKLVLSGELKKFPIRTWNQPDSVEFAAEILRYLIENIFKWNDDEIIKKYSATILRKNKLSGLLAEVFDNSPYQALNAAYPGRFEKWDKYISKKHWSKEKIIKTAKWLFEVKLKWSDEEIKKNFTLKTLKENDLKSLCECELDYCSPWKIINLAYPGRFKEWELASTPKNYWTIETGILAVKWLFEEKLSWSEDLIKKNLSVKVFTENGLRGLLRSIFKDSPFRAIDAAYPNRFDSKDFRLWRRVDTD